MPQTPCSNPSSTTHQSVLYTHLRLSTCPCHTNKSSGFLRDKPTHQHARCDYLYSIHHSHLFVILTLLVYLSLACPTPNHPTYTNVRWDTTTCYVPGRPGTGSYLVSRARETTLHSGCMHACVRVSHRGIGNGWTDAFGTGCKQIVGLTVAGAGDDAEIAVLRSRLCGEYNMIGKDCQRQIGVSIFHIGYLQIESHALDR